MPQASGKGLHDDKGKAYKQKMRREKDQQKREAPSSASGEDLNPALGSYHNMQRSLNTFYQQSPAQDALRKENERLKMKLMQHTPQSKGLDRLQLMEQSYQMAAKYFPGAARAKDSFRNTTEKKIEDPHF